MNLNKPVIVKDLERFKKNNPVWKVGDIYESQLNELFEVTHPHLIHSPSFKKIRSEFVNKKRNDGNWIYFPWSGYLIHIVNEKDYYLLRTNRNRNLIKTDEQQKLKNFTVGMVGLSVGGNIAVSLAYQGIADSMKLADFDSLETTNLNRVRAGIHQIGLPKTVLIAQQIYEINPYANLKLYPNGLTKENLDDFVSGKPKVKLIFEIIDGFEMKIRLRLKAKSKGIAVVMLTNLGDSILVDTERYDLDRKLLLFNGLLGKIPEEILGKPISESDKIKYAAEIVGKENIPQRALQSLSEINKTLVGRPQLSSTVIAASGIASFLTRRLALGQSLPSGRQLISLDKILNLGYDYSNGKR